MREQRKGAVVVVDRDMFGRCWRRIKRSRINVTTVGLVES